MIVPQLCITADDYGIGRGVNAAIEQLAAMGRLQAVSVMVHEGAELDTLDTLRATGAALGIHLVFDERPGGYKRALGRIAVPGAMAKLAAELEAQIERYLALGLSLDFVNSHEHVHVIPRVWKQTVQLAERYGAKAIRSAAFRPVRMSRDGALALASRASWSRRPARGMRVMSPLAPVGAGRVTVAGIAERIDMAGDGSELIPELVTHPAADDAVYGGDGENRLGDFDALRSDALGALLAERAVTLVKPV